MKYKTIVLSYEPKAKKVAQAIEEKANEMAKEGFELVTLTQTGSAKAILVFKCPKEEIEPNYESK